MARFRGFKRLSLGRNGLFFRDCRWQYSTQDMLWAGVLSCFDAQDADTQHLPRQGMVYNATDDLLPIRRVLAVVDLPIVSSPFIP